MKDPLVLVSVETLREIVREAVADALKKAPAEPEPGEIMRTQHVAKLLAVTPQTVVNLAKSGGLPTCGRIGTQWRFRRSEILALLAERKKSA